MLVTAGKLAGVVIIEPKVFGDTRGFFLETWNARRYAEAGVPATFVQDNISYSGRGTLRGLHFQNPNPQGKLVGVLIGEVYDVVVDLRRSSPTCGQWAAVSLTGESKRQLYVPPGFAHGFQVVSDAALFHYKCTHYYAPADEHTLRWDDPDLAIPWPLPDPLVSPKDAKGIRLSDLGARLLD
jgi:dTDP-4-dehydrorhamnose 3,5-epimerase